MRRRRNADEVAKLLREADRDLAKGLTVGDVCRKLGIAQNTYYRWRQRHAPAGDDPDRRCRELEIEVNRLKMLVAELLLDKQMLQDIAKKSGEPQPAAGRLGLLERGVWHLATADLPCHGAFALDRTVSARAPRGRFEPEPGDQTLGASPPSIWLPPHPRPFDPAGLVSQPQASTAALDRTGAETPDEATKTQETRPETGSQREQLRPTTIAFQERRLDLRLHS